MNTIYTDLVQSERFYMLHKILTFQSSLAKWNKSAADNDFLKYEKKLFHFSQFQRVFKRKLRGISKKNPVLILCVISCLSK